LQKANVTELMENIFTLRISDSVVHLGCSSSYKLTCYFNQVTPNEVVRYRWASRLD